MKTRRRLIAGSLVGIPGNSNRTNLSSEETEKQVPVLSRFPCWPIPESPLSYFLLTNISPKWPLISRKKTTSEYDKINNCAMIQHSHPLCDNWRSVASVRTVINMLHLLNQLIVYTIWKLAFSKLTLCSSVRHAYKHLRLNQTDASFEK
jgi:hypothetical protein